MADTQAIIEVKAIGTEKAGKQFTQFENTVTRSMTASESSVARAFSRMAAQYLSMAYVMSKATKLMSSGVEFNKFVENQTMSFSVMMKSAEKAKAQMKDLYDFAVNSPLTFKETAGSAKQLMAYGFAAKELIPTMRSLGSVAIATGTRLDDMAYIYGTLRSQGRAYSRDLMQFAMRGIPIYEELAKVMGVGADKIQKMASQGKIGFKEVEKAFKNMTTNGGKFAGIIDGYMKTLTGKLAMFGDIAEQASGELMSGATAALKGAVDELTRTFSSVGFQEFITNMGIAIGDLSKDILGIGNALVRMLPIITKIVSLLVIMKATSFAKTALFRLPDILLKGAEAMDKMAKSGANLGTLMGNVKTSGQLFVSYLKDGLPVILASAGAFVAIVASVAAINAGMNYMRREAEKNRKSAYAAVREKQLSEDYYVAPFSVQDWTKAKTQVEDVARLAEEYQLTEGVVARILIQNKVIEQSAWNQYLNNKAAKQALEEYAKVQEGIQHVALTMEQEQMNFLSGLTGLPASIYEDFSNVDLNALGNQGAKDYIAGFAQERQKEKDIFGFVYSTDMLKDSLSKEMEGITAALRAGSKVDGLFNTQYDETLRNRLASIALELDGIEKNAKKLKNLPKLDKWWLPEDSAVAATLTAIDDVTLASEKALYNAQKEIDAREEIIRVNLDAVKTMNESVDKAKLIAKWEAESVKLSKEREQIINDITKAQERLVNVKKYEEFTGQSGGMFTMFEANAGASLQKAIDSLNMDSVDMSGFLKNMGTGLANTAGASMGNTEVGAAAQGFASGGVVGLIVTIVAKFITLIAAIENVGKSFDAITTIWESMKSVSNIVEIFNNAFEPITKHLEQVGEAIAPLIAVFVGLIKIANVFMYIMNSGALIALQMLSEAFKWFYNGVIYPVGNMIVKIVNAIIKVLNKLPFVHIKYLDTLEKVTDATKDFSSMLSNVQGSLDATIQYLENKLEEIYDKQLESIQELYEVGALSATQYEKMVNDLNATRLDQDPLVSYADKQLKEQRDILARLGELYNLQNLMEQNDLTEAQIVSILTRHGLTADSLASKMSEAIALAIKNIDTASGNDFGSVAGKVTDPITGLPPGVIPGGPGTTTTGTAPTSGRTAPESPALSGKQINGIIGSYKNIFDKMRVDDIRSYYTSQGYAGQAAQSQAQSLMSSYVRAKNAFYSKWDSYGITNDYAGFTSAKNEFINTWGKYTPAFAVGTGRVPQDMVANIHKDEGIIPKTFMDSIRSGELTLGGKNQASGQTTVININIEGTVVSERNLAESVSGVLYKMRSKGLVTV